MNEWAVGYVYKQYLSNRAWCLSMLCSLRLALFSLWSSHSLPRLTEWRRKYPRSGWMWAAGDACCS